MTTFLNKLTNSSKSEMKGNLTLNILQGFKSTMQQLSLLFIILILNFVNCAVAISVGGGGNGVGVVGDVKNSIASQDQRMLPAEVYPWNILSVPDYSVENENVKRSSWQKLHGTWGKRNLIENGVGSNAAVYHNLENFDEANNPINHNSIGNNIGNNDLDNEMDGHENPTDHDYQELIKFEEIYSLPSSIVNDLLKPSALYNEKKRAWRNLNVAWGKRRPSNEWNKFRGAWGKREPGWNNLKGLWGKRASNWNKLNSAWGKRSAEDTMEVATN